MKFFEIFLLCLAGLIAGVIAKCDDCLTKEEAIAKSLNWAAMAGTQEGPCFIHTTNGMNVCLINMDPWIKMCDCVGGVAEPEVGGVAGPEKPTCKTIEGVTCPDQTTNEYCTNTALYGSKHSGCINCQINATACATPCYRGLTTGEQAEIVKAHNDLRSRVALGQETKGNLGPQPNAKDMIKLEWSSELASMAQKWADQCQGGHDQNNRRVPPYNKESDYIGQNAAWNADSDYGKQLTQFVKSWYNEVGLFPKDTVMNWNSVPNTGHYTQVVWAKTQKIGCGFIMKTDADYGYKRFLVCNYWPAGNFKSNGYADVYQIGAPATGCPSGFSSNTITGLCTKP